MFGGLTSDWVKRVSGGLNALPVLWLGVFACTMTALASICVLPQLPDPFEGPRRLVWGTLAVSLAVVGLLRRDWRDCAFRCETVFGAVLLVWMLARSFAVGSFWRAAAPLIAWMTPLVLFLVAARFSWNAASWRILARTIVVLGLAEAGLMLLQRFGFDPLFGEATHSISYAPGRMIGTIGYQNQAAEFLGVAICCVPAVSTDRRFRIAAILLLAATIALSSNRGALLALAVVGVPWVLRAIRWRRRNRTARSGFRMRVFAILLLVVAAVAAVPELRSRIGELRDPAKSHGVQSRAWMSRVALSLWKDRPVLGWGAGGYAWEYVDRLGSILPERKEHEQLKALVWAREAHCDPLQFGAEFGLVGVVLALAFAVSAIRAVLAAAGAGPAAAATFLTVCSLFSFSWQTSFAAPAAGLLLGVAAGGGRVGKGSAFGASSTSNPRTDPLSAVAALFAAGLAIFVPVAETLVSIDLDEAYWDYADGAPPMFLKGRWLADCAKLALNYGQPLQAAEMCSLASETWMSPDLLVTSASALEAAGHGNEAADVWLRLARCGLRYDEALKRLSLCLERGKRFREAADAEAERFRLWPTDFSDGELFRLCALSLMSDNAARAENLSGRFRARCKGLGELDRRWTPAWENLRGGALLALGRREEARACFESALRRDPGLKSARKNLDSMR